MDTELCQPQSPSRTPLARRYCWVLGTTPVRLAHTPTRCRVVPVARIKRASVFAACAAADPGFVHFDVFVRATPDAILARADHSGAKLMEDLEGCLIAR